MLDAASARQQQHARSGATLSRRRSCYGELILAFAKQHGPAPPAYPHSLLWGTHGAGRPMNSRAHGMPHRRANRLVARRDLGLLLPNLPYFLPPPYLPIPSATIRYLSCTHAAAPSIPATFPIPPLLPYADRLDVSPRAPTGRRRARARHLACGRWAPQVPFPTTTLSPADGGLPSTPAPRHMAAATLPCCNIYHRTFTPYRTPTLPRRLAQTALCLHRCSTAAGSEHFSYTHSNSGRRFCRYARRATSTRS